MKKSILIAVMVSASTLLVAQNLMKTATYQVFPGNWHKALINSKTLGKYIDPDLDRATNKRKGLLADGKIFQRAVCYNYHGANAQQRFVTVVVDLGKEYAVEKITLGAMQNNDMYKPAKYTVEVSSDNVAFAAFASGDKWNEKHRFNRTAELTAAAKKCRYVRVKVWATNSWLNLTEIGVYGK